MSSLSDVEWIYIVLTVMYASEMLIWVRPGSIAFVSSWGTFGSRVSSRRLTGNGQGNLVLGWVAPFDVTFIAETFPLSITRDGVVAFVAAAPLASDRREQSGREWSWSQLADVSADEREVHAGGKVVHRAGSKSRAQQLANDLRRLAACDDRSRAQAIEDWRRGRFDVSLATNRWNQWQEATLALRITATMFFIWVYPVGILLHYGWLPFPSDRWVTNIYLAILFAGWWLTVGCAWMAHRSLYEEKTLDRWKQLSYSLLSPAVPLRLSDQLGRELFGWMHPLAISAAIDSSTKFKDVAALVLRDATYPMLPEQPPEISELAIGIIRDSRIADEVCLTTLLASRNVVQTSLLTVPEAVDETVASYCPRCLHEFTVDDAICDSCGGRPCVSMPRGDETND